VPECAEPGCRRCHERAGSAIVGVACLLANAQCLHASMTLDRWNVETLMSKVIVFLVHGTGARNAPWTQAGSIFRNELIQQLREMELEFRAPNWSGGNSHKDRLAGGEKLASELRQSVSKNQGCPHFIIAHSHGGNAALYALRNAPAEVRSNVHGLITMATPFIQSSPRNLRRSIRILRWATPLFGATLLFAPLFMLFGFFVGLSYEIAESVFGSANMQTLRNIELSLLLVISASMVVLLQRYFDRRCPPWAIQKQRAIIARLEHSGSAWVRLLPLWNTGDEAGWWLSRLHSIGMIPFRLWNLWFFRILFIMLVAFFMWDISGMEEPAVRSSGWLSPMSVVPEILRAIIASVILASVLVAVLLLITQLVMAVVPRVVRSHAFAFGGETVVDNWLVNIQAAKAPSSQFKSELREFDLPLSTWSRLRKRLLRHSMLYEDISVISLVSKWIRERLDESQV
jgi:hypothetical protein